MNSRLFGNYYLPCGFFSQVQANWWIQHNADTYYNSANERNRNRARISGSSTFTRATGFRGAISRWRLASSICSIKVTTLIL